MAKLKYDRPLKVVGVSDNRSVTVPIDEVWKVSYGFDTDPGVRTLVCGGVRASRISQFAVYWHRLQTHRRISDSVEVVLHG